ncbi:MAG TPA: tetratricopeptide repeat protein [Pyrinomonadaceae bacterium]|jgi:tetratricopeptide (TPR) repeat protein|nr:tetratricopeptide repeat protein [Pyrinomonadaceae bacterium]
MVNTALQKTSNCFNRSLVISALVALCVFLSGAQDAAAQRKRTVAAPTASAAAKAIVVRTEPEAAVWLDEIRRGTTDASGQLAINNITAGRHTLRVRAAGFKEKVLPVLAAQRGEIKVALAKTTDRAEILFQEAEAAREKAKDDEARKAAADVYRSALKIRPLYPAARVGLARILLDLNQYTDALDQIALARRARPVYPEASAVEGRIQRMAAFIDEAITSFRRSIREARGFQPEAHTGLALIYEERGMNEEAATEFRAAIEQLLDTEPVLYQLLGAVYEKMEKYKEAVEAYEKYLQLAPEGSLAPAVRSIIDQLRRQAAEQETPS